MKTFWNRVSKTQSDSAKFNLIHIVLKKKLGSLPMCLATPSELRMAVAYKGLTFPPGDEADLHLVCVDCYVLTSNCMADLDPYTGHTILETAFTKIAAIKKARAELKR